MKRRKPKTLEEYLADRETANRIIQETLRKFLAVLDQHEPPTPRQKAERRGLRIIEGGKTR